MLSVPHMIVVFLVVLVVFGPQKLPELARSLGKLMAEFRKASGDFKSAFEEEIRDLERQARIAELKKQASEAVAAAKEGLTTNPVTMGSPEGPPAVAPYDPVRAAAESVPRLDAKPVETAATNPEAPAGSDGEATASAKSPSESTPSHDQQQPA